ncbi:zinc ribbon domain-containing protein [Synechocystis salina LEGE 06155]|nr:zinc ribbon domain-containing protein [Synechocystis salina LEGE 06155]
MTHMNINTSLLMPRKFMNPLVGHLKLPINSIGEVFIENIKDSKNSKDFLQWFHSLSQTSIQTINNWTSFIANPFLLADIRIYYHQTSQLRTWALTGKIEDDAPWLFIAPVNGGQDYKIHPVEGRDVLVNSLFAYIEPGSPIWETDVSFQCTLTEFSVLVALVDIYSRIQYASLILHQPVSLSISIEDLLQAYDNVTEYEDQRYLFWTIVHFLPQKLQKVDHNELLNIINKLVQRQLIEHDGNKIAWTESGLFLISSLHRRLCTLAIDLLGYNEANLLGRQGALLIRAENSLWFFDIDPSPNGLVSVVSIDLDKAYKLLDEIFTPVGEPQMEFSIQSFEKKTTSSSPESSPEVLTAKYCLACHQPLQDADKFCTHCGASVQIKEPPKPQICPQCGHTPTPGAKFCGNCGFVLEVKS